jgi:TPR repeat protein
MVSFVGRLSIASILLSAIACPANATLPPTESGHLQEPPHAPMTDTWERVLAAHDVAGISKTYGLVAKIYQQRWEVSAHDCIAYAEDIDAALQTNPVSFAVSALAEDCARAVGDSGALSKRSQSMHALMQESLSILPPENVAYEKRALPVFSEMDAYAFVHASGEELLLAYYDLAPSFKRMPLALVLRDTVRQTQHTLWFDVLGPQLQLQQHPEARFPDYRQAAARQLLKEFALPGSAAESALAFLNAADFWVQDDMTAVESVARDGHFGATAHIARTCLLDPDCKYSKQAVDLLRPWTSRENAYAKLLLAQAYSNGQGAPRDPRHALELIHEVNEMRGDNSGFLEFAAMQLARNKAKIDPLVRDEVVRLADARDPLAETLLADEVWDPNVPLDHGILLGLTHAAESGLPAAEMMLARALLKNGTESEGLVWLKKAAAAGDTIAQSILGDAYRDSKYGLAYDFERSVHWNELASLDDDGLTMALVGYQYWRHLPSNPANRYLAQRWLQNSVRNNNRYGAGWLAHLYEEDATGVDGGDGKAVNLYRWLVGSLETDAYARWYLARLLSKRTDAIRNKVEIDSILAEAEKNGDAKSQGYVASALLNGIYGPSDPIASAPWYQHAIERGNDRSRSEYALMLLDGIGVERDIPAAFVQWEAALKSGEMHATRDMAWALCTHRDESIRNPTRGVEIAKKLSMDEYDHLETMAACYAAVGNFDQAVSTAEAAIETLARANQDDAIGRLDKLQEELVGYRNRQAYVMDEPWLRQQIRQTELVRLERTEN